MNGEVAVLTSRMSRPVRPRTITSERRRRRSSELGDALQHQLEYVRARLGLEALVLCDDLGEILALAGEPAIVKRAAEQAPWLAATPTWDLEEALAYFWDVRPGLCSAEVAVRRIRLPGGVPPLLLVGIGPSTLLEPWVEHAARGVARIFATLT